MEVSIKPSDRILQAVRNTEFGPLQIDSFLLKANTDMTLKGC